MLRNTTQFYKEHNQCNVDKSILKKVDITNFEYPLNCMMKEYENENEKHPKKT